VPSISCARRNNTSPHPVLPEQVKDNNIKRNRNYIL